MQHSLVLSISVRPQASTRSTVFSFSFSLRDGFASLVTITTSSRFSGPTNTNQDEHRHQKVGRDNFPRWGPDPWVGRDYWPGWDHNLEAAGVLS